MNGLIDTAFHHARTVLACLVLVLIAGTVAYVQIPKESDPDISIPIIYVQMKHEGISPEDAERLLVRPMEQELRAIEGVKEMRSRGYEGGGSVTLEFDAGFDVDKAMGDVREKVDLAQPDLPDDTEDTLDIRLAKLGSESIIDVVEQIEKGTVRRIPQSEQESSYFPQPTNKQRKLLANMRGKKS